jgi:hypothetical protein
MRQQVLVRRLEFQPACRRLPRSLKVGKGGLPFLIAPNHIRVTLPKD